MKKNWILGFLGIAVILFNYVGFPHTIKSAFIIALGLAVSFVSFRAVIKNKIALRMTKNDDAQKTEKAPN